MKPTFASRLLARLFGAALCLSLLPGCGIVYRIDVQQGNEITTEMLAELELGMSRAEVGKTLGLPLLNHPFHADRWDYYFYLKKGETGTIEAHSATLHFNADALRAIESPLLDADDADDATQ
ncbi:MAG: outer membrane protein assembly factor BamE [bacterium]